MRKFKRTISVTIISMLLIGAVLLTGCQNMTDDTNTNAATEAIEGTTDTAADTAIIYNDLQVGDKAPDFDFELLNDETVKLSDYQGKVILLNFWATWCGPCVSEMPDIQKISDTYPDEVVVLAINCSESRDTVNSFIEKNGYTFYVGLDENQEIAKKYPTDGIPYSVIIDGDGIITSIHLGSDHDMFSVFEEDIKSAL